MKFRKLSCGYLPYGKLSCGYLPYVCNGKLLLIFRADGSSYSDTQSRKDHFGHISHMNIEELESNSSRLLELNQGTYLLPKVNNICYINSSKWSASFGILL